MFTLVIFNDGIYHICKSKDIIKHGNECVAKYRNVKYTCRIVAQHKNITVLNNIKHSLTHNVPKIILKRITLPNVRGKQNLLQIHNREGCFTINCNIMQDNINCNTMQENINCNTMQDNISKNIYDEGLSYVSSKNSSNESFIQPVMDQATNSVVKQINSLANSSNELHILSLLNVPDRVDQDDVGNLNEAYLISNTMQDKDLSYVLNTSFEKDFVQPVIDQATNFVPEQINNSAITSSRFQISTTLNVSDKGVQDDIRNLNEGNFPYNWHGNTFEVYEDYDLFEPITAEATISKYSEIGSSVSTEAYLNNKSVQNNNDNKSVQDNNDNNSVQDNNNNKFVQDNNDNKSVQDNNDNKSVQDNNNNKSVQNNNDKSVEDNISKNISDGDQSYIPSDSSSDESFVQPMIDQTTNSLAKETNSSANTSSGLDISMSLFGKSSRDDTEMFVTSVGAGNKKHFCMYCNTFQSKIARHLERAHANELEVQKFIHMPKGNPERRKILETIRRRGDFYFNTDCARNDGELLVERRSKKEYNRTASEYVVCPKCKAFILKLTSRHHYQRCIKEMIKTKDSRSISILGRQIIGRIHNEASNALRLRVFPLLREDDIIRGLRYDELIIAFGNQQCEKYKTSDHNDAMIRQKIRKIGRLLQALKFKNSNITDFSSIYFPRYSNTCIETINTLAGLSLCGKFYKTPSLASALGGLIKEVGKLLINRCIRKEEEERKLRVEDFLKVFTEDFATRISKTIMETMSRNMRRKKIILPSKADIIKLHNFLKQERETAYNFLREKFTYDAWLSLTKATLTSIQVFNRRRAGEIQRTLIEDYKAYEGIDYQTHDMYKALSPRAKEIAKKYVRFTLRGKLGRTVPVLLTEELRDCIEMILKHRKAAKVSSKNPYLFGLPSLKKDKHKYLLACDLLRQYAIESGAENPETIRATELRKHIATICVHYNLSENEVSTLANFMGHADKIHLSHYRQPVIEKEILEISQYLEAAQGADMNESDSNDSNFELSDTENTTKSTETYDDSINKEIRASRSIRDIQQDIDENTDMLPDIRYLDNNIQNDQNVINKKEKLIQNKKDFQQRKKSSVSNRNRWTQNEKCIVLDAFNHYINSTDKLPTFNEIGKLIKKHPELKHRSVPMIKTWVHNQKRIKMKQMKI